MLQSTFDESSAIGSTQVALTLQGIALVSARLIIHNLEGYSALRTSNQATVMPVHTSLQIPGVANMEPTIPLTLHHIDVIHSPILLFGLIFSPKVQRK